MDNTKKGPELKLRSEETDDQNFAEAESDEDVVSDGGAPNTAPTSKRKANRKN